MPKMKEDDKNGTLVTPAAGAVPAVAGAKDEKVKKERKPRIKINEQTYAIWEGGRNPKSFVQTIDEVKKIIQEAKKPEKIVVFKRVPLKVTVSTQIEG